MNGDIAPEVHELLEQHADRAPRPSGLRSTTVRRARVHRIGLAAFSCLALVTVLVAGIRITSAVIDGGGGTGVIPIPPAKQKQTTESAGEIAFTRYGKVAGIYVVNTSNGHIRRVISEGAYAIAGPAWSPDGRKIAFHGFFGKASAANNGEGGGLFVVNADGSHLKLLRLDGTDPAWSPDGKRIASEAGGAISLIRADGQGFKLLTDKVQGDLPTWSPDGTRITFVTPRGAIYVVDADGSHLHPIAGGNGLFLDYPAWSPDGSKIAFTRYGKGTKGSDIYTMNADGSGAALLVANASSATWSPDGTQIAFSRATHDHGHIYIINIDGTNLTQLTHGTGDDSGPAWKP